MLLPTQIVWLMFGLLTKHFICDFLIQTKYQYSNKHILGHLGGILHALIHVIGTCVVGWLIVPKLLIPYLVTLSMFEGIIHYFTDWAKMNINIHFGWKCNTNEEFWWLTGFDQWIHGMCYIVILLFLI